MESRQKAFSISAGAWFSVLFAMTGCPQTSSSKSCLDRDKVTEKMAHVVQNLQGAGQAGTANATVAESELKAAAMAMDSLGDEVSMVPAAVVEFRNAAQKLRSAANEIRKPGGGQTAATELVAATQHFSVGGTRLTEARKYCGK